MKQAIRKFSETVKIRSSWLNRIRSHRYFQWAMLAVIVLMVSGIHIWQRVKVLDLVHEVSLLRKENTMLADDARKVNSEIAALSKASRIQTYAADSLGLVTVPAERLFTLIRSHEDKAQIDDVSLVLSAVRRMTRYLPTVTKDQVSAGQLRNYTIDSLANRGGDK